jgi:hypothetical protein
MAKPNENPHGTATIWSYVEIVQRLANGEEPETIVTDAQSLLAYLPVEDLKGGTDNDTE